MLTIKAFDPGTKSSDVTKYCENGTVDGNNKRREDYYTEKGEAGGWLVGDGWQIYGLGKDDYLAQHIQRALDGKDIVDENKVHVEGTFDKQGKSKRVPGWDLTFSVDKSISLAYADGNAEFKAAIIRAQEYAVARAMKYIEDNIAIVNVAQGGRKRETAKLFCSAHNHYTSRPTVDEESGRTIPGDPDIHTHVITPSFALRSDNQIMSVNSRELYDRQLEAGAIYRAALADYIENVMGYAIEKHGENNEFIRLAASPKDVERAMSKRRQEIERMAEDRQDAMEKYRISEAKAGDFIAKKTRLGKSTGDMADLTREDVEQHWHNQLAEMGYSEGAIVELLEASKKDKKPVVFSDDDVLLRVTNFKSVFDKFDLRQAIAFAGAGALSVEEIEAKYDELMKSDKIQKVAKVVINKTTGEATAKFLYTTQEMIDTDKGVIALAKELRASTAHTVAIEIVDQMRDKFELKTGFKLSKDQIMALTAATQGSDLVIIEGHAGSGKTASIVIAKEALESAGFNVLGCAPSGKAAKGLDAAGIPSVTIAKLLMDAVGWTDAEGKWHAPKRPLTSKDIIVIDEAGMISSRDWHALERAAKEAGAKLIFMGDRKQIQSVGAGGPMNAVIRETGDVDATLDTVHRQKQGTQIANVVALSRDGNIHRSLTILEEMGNLALVDDKKAGLTAAIDAWKKHYDHNSDKASESCILLASTNTDTDRLNKLARQHLKDIGVLDASTAKMLDITDKAGNYLMQKEFCDNDRIIFLTNAKIGRGRGRIEIKNGETARIMSIEGKTVTAKLEDSNRVISFSTDDYSRFSHALAITTHKSQGITTNWAVILGSSGGMQTLNQTYVQLSRCRHGVDFILPKQDIELAMAVVDPTDKMLGLAYRTADRLGHDRDMINGMSFLECRDYLNEHTKWVVKGKEESEPDRLFRELGSLLTRMQTLDVKETTLDYEIVDKHSDVVNVHPRGELSATAEPKPMRYNGAPRVLDTTFERIDNQYAWKDSGTVAFVSKPDQVAVKSKENEAIVASLQLAKEKFGNTITTNGSESFRQKTWLEGTALGMEIQGYTPTKEDRRALEEKLEAIAEAKATQSEVQVYELTDDDYEYVAIDDEEEYVPEPEPKTTTAQEDEYMHVM